MHKLLFFFLLLHLAGNMAAQQQPDTSKTAQEGAAADDPSQFITRIEVYNELQFYNKSDVYLNQTIFRTIVKIGKKFTTRVDLPYVHNSYNSPAKYKQSGLGDISFRLLGYKIFESKKAAITASIEISMNTAESPLLGLGKNLVIPMVTYTKAIPQSKVLLAAVFQQANSISGDVERADVSFSKLQLVFIKILSKRTWMVVAPEWFLDYVRGGMSMNLRSRMGYVVTPRINLWMTPSAGIFGDFPGRYQWSADIGARYFLFRALNVKKAGR